MSRPFCCTTCGRRAWSAVPEDVFPIIAFTAPVDEVDDVNLVALDGIFADPPTADTVPALERPLLADAPPVRPRHARAASKRRRKRRGDTVNPIVH